MKPASYRPRALLLGFVIPLVLSGPMGCGPGPTYRTLTPGEEADLRSAIGEKRSILDVSEYGPTLHVIIEFPRSLAIQTIDRDCCRALEKIQEELRSSAHSLRPVVVWGHSEPNEDSTFRLIGYAETDSASGEIVWMSYTRVDREIPVPRSR